MKRTAAYAVLILLLLLACGAQKRKTVAPSVNDYPDSLRSVYYLTEGLRHVATDSTFAEAFTMFHNALKYDSLCAPAMYQLATIYAERGDTLGALNMSRNAMRIDTTNNWYRLLYGRLLLFDNRYEEALGVFTDITRRAPTDPDNYRMLAALYMQQKMPFAAISVLDSAEVKAGLSGELHLQKCALLANTGQPDKALSELLRYRQINPYDEDANLFLATLYGYLHKDSLQVAVLKEVLDANPTNTEALMNLSTYYRTQGNAYDFLATTNQLIWNKDITPQAKINMFNDLTADIAFYGKYYQALGQTALAIYTQYPDNYAAANLYARHLWMTGERNKALAVYIKQIDNPQAGFDNMANIIGIEMNRQNIDSVMYYCDMAIDRYGNTAEPYILKSAYAQLTKQYDLAGKLLKTAAKHADNDSLRSVIAGQSGDNFHASGNTKKAVSSYMKAIRLDSKNATAYNNCSYFLTEDGNSLPLAEALAARAVDLDPNNATFLDTYAWALFKNGKTAEAKTVMQKAISLDNTNSAVLYVHYGDILYALGEKFMAKIYWKKAAENGYDAAEIATKLKQQ